VAEVVPSTGAGKPRQVGRWRAMRRGGAVEVLSWTTVAGRRFKERLCGRVSGGEVEVLVGQCGASPERLDGAMWRGWSGGVLEAHPRTIEEPCRGRLT